MLVYIRSKKLIIYGATLFATVYMEYMYIVVTNIRYRIIRIQLKETHEGCMNQKYQS